MSFALLKKNISATWKYFVIICAVLALYMGVIIVMFNPEQPDLTEIIETMNLPKDLLHAFGMTQTSLTLNGFIGSYLYGLLFLALPLIYTVLVANRLVAAMVDRGSMANILSTKWTRRQVALTQAVSLILGVALMMAFITAFGILCGAFTHPGLLDIAGFVRLNAELFVLHVAIAGFAFLASCFFNESSNMLMIGAGVPVLMLLLRMLGDVGEDFHWLRNLSIFSLFDANGIIMGAERIPQNLVLAGLAIVFFALGVAVFDRKDLPL